DRIRATVSPALERRIDAALARSQQAAATPAAHEPRREPWIRPWLAGSLSGLAVAAAIVLLVGRPDERMPAATPVPQSVAEQKVPEYITLLREQLPLRAETADLTAPLEKELENLQSDIEKARDNLERDLRLAF
ncbi:MAG TPA: anti-sigma factor, partial [Woeseiaceae bacterium]